MHMRKSLVLGLAIAFCCSLSYSPVVVAKDVGTPVLAQKEKQVFQAPVVVELSAYKVCDLAAADYILIAPTQAAALAAVVPLKVNVPVVAAKAMGGPPRSSPARYAYGASYCNRFSNSRGIPHRLYHIDPGLRGC